jgi:hypothetical protein
MLGECRLLLGWPFVHEISDDDLATPIMVLGVAERTPRSPPRRSDRRTVFPFNHHYNESHQPMEIRVATNFLAEV